MADSQVEKKIKFDEPALYRIRIKGHIAESLSDQLGGMIVTRAFTADKHPMTILIGKLMDQAALSGVLTELYEMHMPLLTVESISPEKENVVQSQNSDQAC